MKSDSITSQFCSFWKLFGPSKFLWFSTYILGSTCQFLSESLLRFWLRLYWIYDWENIDNVIILRLLTYWHNIYLLFRSLNSLISGFQYMTHAHTLLDLPVSSSHFSIINGFLISIFKCSLIFRFDLYSVTLLYSLSSNCLFQVLWDFLHRLSYLLWKGFIYILTIFMLFLLVLM